MSVRNSHSRPAKTSKWRKIAGIQTMFTWDWQCTDGQVAYLVRKAEQGKLQIPEGMTAIHLKADKTLMFGKIGDNLALQSILAKSA